MKTIKQIADELGVSKTAVRKKIENLGLQSGLQKNGNQFAITEEQENLIKSAFLGKEDVETETKSQTETETKSQTETKTKSQTETETVSALVSMLQRELEIKNEQIRELNARLAESQKLLDQQQHLNAVSVSQNQNKVLELEAKTEEPKERWWQKLWK